MHRDIKPANILIENASGRAMVTDFGIARLAQAGGETAVGEVLGTPEYMSPEQATAEPVDGRSDLYSLGVVGYYMMTGALPFTANTAQAMIAQHVTKAPPSVSETAKGVPRSIAMAIDKCLAKDPADRFDRGEALAEALSPSLEKSEDVPVPIRVFLDRRRMLQLIIAPALVASVGPMTILAVGKLFDRAMPLSSRWRSRSRSPCQRWYCSAGRGGCFGWGTARRMSRRDSAWRSRDNAMNSSSRTGQ